MRLSLIFSIAVLPLYSVLLSCGGAESNGQKEDITTSGEQADSTQANVLTDITGTVSYNSPEGEFQVVWPDGCSTIRYQGQSDPNSDDPHDFLKIHVFCDRKDRPNEGCSVTVFYKERGEFGGPPGPPRVIDICKDVMQSFGVEILDQRALRRGEFEGIQLRCQEPGDTGQLMLEGLLLRERIYILAAWKATGQLFADPEIIRFFDSFSLHQP